jgi:hypothetical protein
VTRVVCLAFVTSSGFREESSAFDSSEADDEAFAYGGIGFFWGSKLHQEVRMLLVPCPALEGLDPSGGDDSALV